MKNVEKVKSPARKLKNHRQRSEISDRNKHGRQVYEDELVENLFEGKSKTESRTLTPQRASAGRLETEHGVFSA